MNYEEVNFVPKNKMRLLPLDVSVALIFFLVFLLTN